MKNKLSQLTFILILALSACAPQVTLLPLELETPHSPAAVEPTAIPTPTSTPVPGSQLGVGADALQGVTVNLWHGFGGSEATLINQLAAEFNLSNPWGITVNPVSQQNFSILFDQVNQSVKTSTPPDLVIGLSEHAISWDEAGLVVDASGYLINPEFGLPPADLADIPAVFLAQDEQAGKRVGFPMLRSARVIFYNQTWAKELGFNSPPKTADEFRQQACAANAFWKSDLDESNDGFGGWVVDGDPYTAYGWFTAFKSSLYENGEYHIENAESLQALTFLKELKDDGCAWVSTSSSNYESLVNHKALFLTGNLADINEQTNTFRSLSSTETWTVIPFPAEKQVVPTYGPAYILIKSSQARQLAAWLFVRWMSSPEIQARLIEETGYLPVRSSALELVPASHQKNPQWSAASRLINQMKMHPQSAAWRNARLIVGDGFLYVFRLNLPVSDLPSVLQQMDETIQDLNP